jgi:AP-3 complex subunit mu
LALLHGLVLLSNDSPKDEMEVLDCLDRFHHSIRSIASERHERNAIEFAMDSLVITQEQGIVIIEKHWKEHINSATLLSSIWKQRDESIVRIQNVTLFPIQHSNLYFIGIVKDEIAPLGVYYQLELLLELFVDYFGLISEQVLKDNFSIVYQLLEEWIDYGTPYITEKALLKQIVPPPSLLSTVMSVVSMTPHPTPTSMVSTCPWRNIGINYAHNEIFFDIVEELDCIMDKNGKLLHGMIFGQIECLSRLSGMPELVLSLNKNPLLGLHECVNVERFEENGTISFIPPDGSFTLLDYSIPCKQQQIPLQVKAQLKKTLAGGKKLDLRLVPKIPKDKSFEVLTLQVELPFVQGINSNATHGNCVFDSTTKVLRIDVDNEMDHRPDKCIHTTVCFYNPQ